MTKEQRKRAEVRAHGLATGAEGLTAVCAVLRMARGELAAAALDTANGFDAQKVLRRVTAEVWPGDNWFAVCVALAADPAVPDSGGDPLTDVEAFAPWIGPWAAIGWVSRARDGLSAARHVLDHLADVADSVARRPDAATPAEIAEATGKTPELGPPRHW